MLDKGYASIGTNPEDELTNFKTSKESQTDPFQEVQNEETLSHLNKI